MRDFFINFGLCITHIYRIYRSRLLFLPPPELKKTFADGSGGLSSSGYFKGGTTNSILPCEITKTKEKSQIFKIISDVFRYFEFEGEGREIK